MGAKTLGNITLNEYCDIFMTQYTVTCHNCESYIGWQESFATVNTGEVFPLKKPCSKCGCTECRLTLDTKGAENNRKNRNQIKAKAD
jgi:hypothetical protein